LFFILDLLSHFFIKKTAYRRRIVPLAGSGQALTHAGSFLGRAYKCLLSTVLGLY